MAISRLFFSGLTACAPTLATKIVSSANIEATSRNEIFIAIIRPNALPLTSSHPSLSLSFHLRQNLLQHRETNHAIDFNVLAGGFLDDSEWRLDRRIFS